MKTLLIALSLFSFATNATVLSSAKSCQMANRAAVVTVEFDQDDNGMVEFMFDQANIKNEEIVSQNYRTENVDVFGTTLIARISEYTTSEANLISFVTVGETTQGFVKGPLTNGQKVNLIGCRDSVLWE